MCHVFRRSPPIVPSSATQTGTQDCGADGKLPGTPARRPGTHRAANPAQSSASAGGLSTDCIATGSKKDTLSPDILYARSYTAGGNRRSLSTKGFEWRTCAIMQRIVRLHCCRCGNSRAALWLLACTEHPETQVLLIEAGPPDRRREIQVPAAVFQELLGSSVDWQDLTAPQEHLGGRQIAWPRGRVLGGSGSLSAMIHLRGCPSGLRQVAGRLAIRRSFAVVQRKHRRAREPRANPLSKAFLEACGSCGHCPV